MWRTKRRQLTLASFLAILALVASSMSPTSTSSASSLSRRDRFDSGEWVWDDDEATDMMGEDGLEAGENKGRCRLERVEYRR